ncbi:hypothetical protein JNB63_19390 [Microbacterium trichothecenolyticum]|uniref:Aldo/keto reductase n=1 Tax=Microbacterium ureisolvens TaxID=2781186 RepID=A0ABS7I5G3_9MICO|nr:MULTISPECIES: hypothetical protein [Microbacterium]MBW9111890.1 hypothetical protein [Microbacterium ureisolvens]MBW9122263.1 hypothetical protein [Microbacterium trichothecenolyticum]
MKVEDALRDRHEDRFDVVGLEDSRLLDANALSAHYLERIRAIELIAKDAGHSVPTLTLSWVLRNPAV